MSDSQSSFNFTHPTEKEVMAIAALAEQAGAAIMEVYGRDDFGTVYKEDQSPLTEADLAAHHLIIDGLKVLTPTCPALSEESKGLSYEERKNWGRYWLIDPLDGTKEFVKRNDEFTVNIALISEGRPVMGVVYAPVFENCYYAVEGLGAFKRKKGASADRIQVADALHNPLKIAASRSHMGDRLKAFLDKIGTHELVPMGSSLKLCLVAEGEADLYPRLGPTTEWDTGAAHCVVNEAGGSVTDAEGIALRYNKENLLNPDFFVRGKAPLSIEKALQP